MKLKVKPIINSLSHATVTHEGFEATAIGYLRSCTNVRSLFY